MENTAKFKIEINIDSNTKIVKINGATFIDGKQIIDYGRDVNYTSGVTLDQILSILTLPIESDERFKGTTGAI